jgi:3-dehydroquinate synthase
MPDTVAVNLGERSYPILLDADLTGAVRAKVDEIYRAHRRAAVLTDRNVLERQGQTLRGMFGETPLFVVEPGEGTKTLAEFGRVLDFLAGRRLDRSGALFAVGGGVIGDLGGFAAASYLRGIDYFQVPTTLLAMVDSSVGGKTGVNLAAGKNLVGAFHQPRGVFIATGILATLPPREFAAGMAEVIKYGLLGDAGLFEGLEREALQPGSRSLPGVVRRCCELKARIVEGDEREEAPQGGRALLNLGHTFAHAIEQASGYSGYLHGEAVGIGLCAAARLSARLGLLQPRDVGRTEAVVAAHGLPVRLRTPIPAADLFAAMARDKKARAGEMRFVVLESLGAAATRGGVDRALAEAAFLEVGASKQ